MLTNDEVFNFLFFFFTLNLLMFSVQEGGSYTAATN